LSGAFNAIKIENTPKSEFNKEFWSKAIFITLA